MGILLILIPINFWEDLKKNCYVRDAINRIAKKSNNNIIIFLIYM